MPTPARGPGRGRRGRGCRWAARPRSRSGRSCRPARSGRRPAGTRTRRRPACSAAAAPARFASSVSSAIVTTIWGKTTPCVSGSSGSSSARVPKSAASANVVSSLAGVGRVVVGHGVDSLRRSLLRELDSATTPGTGTRFPTRRVGNRRPLAFGDGGAPTDLNVLFVTVDQWRGDCLGAAGHPVVRTPNLDRLAAGGVSFRRHFAQAAPCGPSRASLYTGMYLMNHRSVLNGTPLDARHTNVALVARRLGYEPALFGYTDTSVDPRTVAPDDPRLRSLRGRAPGLRSGVRPPRGQPRARGSTGCAPRASTSPTTGARFVDQPGATGTPLAHAVRRRAHPDRVPHRPAARLRRRPFRSDERAVVRAPLVSPAAPAVPRARAVRHDVRPGVGAATGPRHDTRPTKARSTRCSALMIDHPVVDVARRSAGADASCARPTTG